MRLVNVQTAVPEDLHATLLEIARRRRQSVKAIVKEALQEFCRHETPLEEDSLSLFIGAGGDIGSDWSERKDWRDPS